MSHTSDEIEYLSRSALAERLSLPLKDLTQMMLDAGWVTQQGKQWLLTAKGEFEGGQYRQSEKYGQYIVWPLSIIEHPVIRHSADDLITVSSLAKTIDIPARLLNRLLYEVGVIEPFAKGWQPTALGKSIGGQLFYVDESGTPYVKWPRSINNRPIFAEPVAQLLSSKEGKALDGRVLPNKDECQIANWLYLQNISFSHYPQLFVGESDRVIPAFYLPVSRVCLSIGQESLKADGLVQLLHSQEKLQKGHFTSISIKAGLSLNELDFELTKSLLQIGVVVY